MKHNAIRFGLAASIGLALLFAFFYFQNLHRVVAQGHRSDFRHFYAASVAMSHGEDVYQSGTGGYVYPPLYAFCLLPLSHLSDGSAAAIALTVNVALMLLCVIVAAGDALGRLCSIDEASRPQEPLPPSDQSKLVPVIALLAALVTFGRIKAELQMLQADVLVLGAFVLASRWIDRRPLSAGIVLGFALNIKYYTLPAIPYLLFRRRWSAAVATLTASIAFAIVPALKVGWSRNLEYLQIAFSGVLRSVGLLHETLEAARVHGIRDPLSVSITSGIARHYRGHEPAVAIVVAIVAALACAFVIVCYTWRHVNFFTGRSTAAAPISQRALFALEWAGIMVAAIVFSPDANMRHFVLLVYANCLAVALLFTTASSSARALLIAAMAIQIIALDVIAHVWSERIQAVFFRSSGPGWAVLLCYLAVTLGFFMSVPAQGDTINGDLAMG